MSSSHPRVGFAKGTRAPAPQVRVLVYAPHATHARWIERELARDDVALVVARDIPHVIAALVEEPAPRPQLLVIDVDAIPPAELLELHAIREGGWFGTIYALGKVPVALRRSLRIDHVLAKPVDHVLRGAVDDLGFDARTRKLPTFDL